MFRQLLKRENTFPNLKVKNRELMFEQFAERAEKLGFVSSKDEFLDSLKERESQGSTEVAPGIAMPHAKSDCVKKAFVMVATSKKGIKYQGFSKVQLVFCLAAPKDDPVYLTILTKTARLLKKKEFVEQITRSDVPEDILNVIFSYEERSGVSGEKGKEGMHFVCLSLNSEEEAESVYPLFLEAGIANATIVESEYLLERLQSTIPLFSAFSLGKGKSYLSKTIFGFSEDKNVASILYGLLKEEGIDIWAPGKGVLFSIQIAALFGGVDPEINF